MEKLIIKFPCRKDFEIKLEYGITFDNFPTKAEKWAILLEFLGENCQKELKYSNGKYIMTLNGKKIAEKKIKKF